MTVIQNSFKAQIKVKHLLALFISMIIIPLLWGLGLIEIPLETYFPDVSRVRFWTFLSTIMFLEWTALFIIYKSLNHDFYEFLSIKKSFLNKNMRWLLVSFVFLLIAAFVSPSYLYSDVFPNQSIILKNIGPVSGLERFCFIFLALTAGVCEEVIFRGYGISVLEKILKNKWLALVFSSLAFMSLHGIAFLPWQLLIQYFIIGLIFGYFYQRYRRLEILILIHFILDALIAVVIP